MKVYRLSHVRALQNNPDPMNPAAAQGRWNDEGWRVAYTSESVALAAMEILGYWASYPNLDGYRLIEAHVPDDLIQDATHVDASDPVAARQYGNSWLESGASLALRVRSVVLPESFNVLVNASHPDFPNITYTDLGPFQFDDRVRELIHSAKSSQS